MPKIPNTSESLTVEKVFTHMGVDLSLTNGKQAGGQCPFCLKDGKFWVNSETGQWDCKVCGHNGNPLTFLKQLWEEGCKEPADFKPLREDRKLLQDATLKAWGVCRSLITGEWLMPSFGADGKFHNLYRMVELKGDDGTWKARLLPCPGIWPEGKVHGLFCQVPLDRKAKEWWVCEGPWDGMALWEAMSKVKVVDGQVALTGAQASSLLGGAAVVAVPGANVFQEGWIKIFVGGTVNLLYDNDHDRKIGDRIVEGAGITGMRKVSRLLASAAEPPESVRCLDWSHEGFNASLKSGFDVRDLLSTLATLKERGLAVLGMQTNLIKPIPEHWVAGRSAGASAKGSVELEPMSCTSWHELVGYWQNALRNDDGTSTWSPAGEGLDYGLSGMMATVMSTEGVDDQLWIKMQGPASTGKSLLADSLGVAKRYIKKLSVLKGLYSGYQTDVEGKEDHSLIKQCINKTLVIKDGDTLMQSQNLPEILSQLRDVYDKSSDTSYKNKTSRSYRGVNMTVVICGTGSLRNLDKSELGQRFLTVIIMDGIDHALEESISMSVAERAARNMGKLSNCSADSREDERISAAKRATGGFVEHIRQGAADLLGQVTFTRDDLHEFTKLATFTAYMRARESSSQDEVKERELAPRLTVQLTRMAGCLMGVFNERRLDASILARVRRTALDTSSGKTLDLCRHLKVSHKIGGLPTEQVAVYQGDQVVKSLKYLQFLRTIGIVELNAGKTYVGAKPRPRWRLTERIMQLGESLL